MPWQQQNLAIQSLIAAVAGQGVAMQRQTFGEDQTAEEKHPQSGGCGGAIKTVVQTAAEADNGIFSAVMDDGSRGAGILSGGDAHVAVQPRVAGRGGEVKRVHGSAGGGAAEAVGCLDSLHALAAAAQAIEDA